MWIWGRIAIWAFRLHVRREVRPEAERNGHARSDVLTAFKVRMECWFDEAWPR